MKLDILTYPDERLRTVCTRAEITPWTRSLAAGMRDLLRKRGYGLAAPQVGHTIRLVVLNVGALPVAYFALFNPVITWASPDQVADKEGCLSDPPTVETNLVVKRSRVIDFQFTNRSGELIVMRAEGLLARVVQHEIDHLDGINIRDRVTAQQG